MVENSTFTKETCKIGKYKILQELGRGGMGIVYAAYDEELDRTVALKTLIPSEEISETAIKRFQREAKLAASVKHPNIIAVHDTGEEKGVHYFVMDYIEGTPISEYVAKVKPSMDQIVILIRQVAEALSAAHAKNIIHRDIKPQNILVDAQGIAYLGDFGLARNIKAGENLTMTSSIIGTPAYMSPEQVVGKTNLIGKPTDIYSLGSVFYELLVGYPPFKENSFPKLMVSILEKEPIPPRKLVQGIPQDIETICLKTLEKNPQRRYPNARALSMDLDRYLKGECIQARKAGILYKTTKWVMRNKVFSLVGLLLLLSLVSLFYNIYLKPGSLTITARTKISGVLKDVYPLITLDGKKISASSMKNYPVSKGYHRIGMYLKDYQPIEFLVDISPGKEMKIERQLEREQGKVTIESTLPALAVFKNKNTKEEQRFSIPVYQYSLDTGEYEIELQKENFFAQKYQTSITTQKPYYLNISLEAMLAQKYSISSSSPLNSVVFADVNSDSELEAVCSYQDGSIIAYSLTNQEKLWQIRNKLPLSTSSPFFLKDIDQDGSLDFIFGHHQQFMSFCGRTFRRFLSVPNFWGVHFFLADADKDGQEDYILLRSYHGVQCYSSRTNELLWQNPLLHVQNDSIFLDKNHVLLAYPNQFALLDIRNGRLEPFFQNNCPGTNRMRLATAGMKKKLVWYNQKAGLFCMDISSKKMEWKASSFSAMPFMSLDVYDLEQDGVPEILLQLEQLHCFDLVTGKEKWSYNSGYPPEGASLMAADLEGDGRQEILVPFSMSGVHILQAQTGQMIAKFVCDSEIRSMSLVDIDNDGASEIFLVSDDSLFCIRHKISPRKIFDQFTTFSFIPPTLIDIDGDNKKEILCIDKKGVLYCLDINKNQVLWHSSFSSITSKVLTGNLIGDQKQEIVVSDNHNIYALNSEGQIVWKTQLEEDLYFSQIFAVEDINSDNRLEIILISLQSISCLEGSTGKVLWKNKADRIATLPLILKNDLSNKKDIVILSGMYYTNHLGQGSGIIYCLDASTGQRQWITQLPSYNEYAYALSAKDLDGNGSPEIFVCQLGGYISCLEGRKGNILWQKMLRGGSLCSAPLIQDWDKDGRKEILLQNIDNMSYCLDAITGEVKWIRWPSETIRIAKDINLDRSEHDILPLEKDIDGDGFCDFLVITYLHSHLFILSGKEGAWLGDTKKLGIAFRPILEDIDSDGCLDMLFIDKMGKLVCLYDLISYLKKIVQPPKILEIKGREALQLCYWEKLAFHKNYQRLERELSFEKEKNYMISFYKAIAYMGQGKINPYLEEFKLIEKTSPRFLDILFLRAVAHLNKEEEEKALSLLQTLISQSILNFDQLYHRFKHFIKQRERFRKLVQKAISNTSCHIELERAYQYALFTAKTHEMDLYIELLLRYGSPKSKVYQECRSLYIQQILDLLSQVNNAYQQHESINILEHALDVLPECSEFLQKRIK